jgi:hypothetical protein
MSAQGGGTVRKLAVVVIILAGALGFVTALFEAASPFRAHAFYGISLSGGSGRITRVFLSEMPAGLHIKAGDRVLETSRGDALRGYELRIPHVGDIVHAVTPDGVIKITARPQFYLRDEALAQGLRELTCGVIILFATFLFVRRPGWMAFGFWIWAISALGGGDVDYALDWLPRSGGMIVSLIANALGFSGLALIPFALRFPSGRLNPQSRLVEAAAWTALVITVVYEIVIGIRVFQGYENPYRDLSIAASTMLPAAAIFLWKQARAAPLDRPKIAWATVAFVGSALLRAVAYTVALVTSSEWRIAEICSNLLALLAIYPILRHRLFDLGFIVNRAALYSSLTLAAFGTLAAANWFAQHFVTERLAFVMQPVAAIAIGLGYFRVRAWIQQTIERVLFRDRFAAEEYLEAVIRGLPFVERQSSVDDVLSRETAETLKLSSSALFHASDGAYVRVAAVHWTGIETSFATDSLLARRILADGPLVTITSHDSVSNGFAGPPHDPVVALGIKRRGILTAIAFYGRHENGTELEPDELKLLKRLGDAAAIAYEAADIAAVRERNRELEERVRHLELTASRT